MERGEFAQRQPVPKLSPSEFLLRQAELMDKGFDESMRPTPAAERYREIADYFDRLERRSAALSVIESMARQGKGWPNATRQTVLGLIDRFAAMP
jgi:hypothetical protein